MAVPVPNDDPEIARLNALLEERCRPILIEHLAIPGGGEDVPDPEAERATIYVASKASAPADLPAHPAQPPSTRTIIVTWPESLHDNAPTAALHAAVLAALPEELQGYPLRIT